jgi:hypothetical protein
LFQILKAVGRAMRWLVAVVDLAEHRARDAEEVSITPVLSMAPSS